MEQLLDPTTIIPKIAGYLHVAPATLVFWFVVVNVAARGIARRIPNDATGFWGFVRQSAAILGVEVSSRVTSGVTVADVAKASLQVPPIPQQVAKDEAEANGPAA